MSKRAASENHLFGSVQPGGFAVEKLYNVDGWVALVTGGGTGLGLVTANALADNGCKVYITGRRKEPLEAAKRSSSEAKGKGEIIPIVADVSTKEGIIALRDAIGANETHLNLLVNNHGVSMGAPNINDCPQTAEGLSKKMFEDESFERWSETYTINTTSYYFTSFAFLPLLAAAKSSPAGEAGNIVILSSMSGITPTSQRGQFNYNAGKAATISLSKMLATEFARRGMGVRVNCICPGYFPSGMTVIHPDENTGSDEQEKDYRDNWGIPFGRPGSAVDYAQCILGLATNKYTTGAEIVIDGGWLLKADF